MTFVAVPAVRGSFGFGAWGLGFRVSDGGFKPLSDVGFVMVWDQRLSAFWAACLAWCAVYSKAFWGMRI